MSGAKPMAAIITPVCDRCGQKGYENQRFAQIKVISCQGHIKVMDLCGGCESLLAGWMELPKTKDERENGNGTD